MRAHWMLLCGLAFLSSSAWALTFAFTSPSEVSANSAPVHAVQAANSAPVGERVSLRRIASAGDRLAHAYVLDHALVAQRLTTRTASGEQTSQDALEFGGRTALRIVDEVFEASNGRPTRFHRLVTEASVHVDMRLQPAAGTPRTLVLDGTSLITGAGILFTYLPTRDEYGRMYDGIESSEEFLPSLFTDIDLACLLPSAPVEVGAKWTIEPPRLVEVFAYGGLVPMRFAPNADPQLTRTTTMGLAGPLYEIFGGEGAGVVSAELVAVEAGIARVALRVDVRFDRDQTERSREKLTAVERYDGLGIERARVVWAFRGEGELRWDVTAGRAVALSLSGAEEVEMSLDLSGPTGASGSDLKLAGGLKLAIDVAVQPKGSGPR